MGNMGITKQKGWNYQEYTPPPYEKKKKNYIKQNKIKIEIIELLDKMINE